MERGGVLIHFKLGMEHNKIWKKSMGVNTFRMHCIRGNLYHSFMLSKKWKKLIILKQYCVSVHSLSTHSLRI